MTRRALGRGLEALIPTRAPAPEAAPLEEQGLDHTKYYETLSSYMTDKHPIEETEF